MNGTGSSAYFSRISGVSHLNGSPLQVSNIQSDALFILLVEKDAAFMRLAEDRFYNAYPCIIITAKGQPDVASRCGMSALTVRFRQP